MKQIKLIYQDCPFCGERAAWGLEQKEFAKAHGIEIVEMSFVAIGARKLILKAAKNGISLPFYTDGQTSSKELKDFIENKPKSATRRKKSNRIKEKNVASK